MPETNPFLADQAEDFPAPIIAFGLTGPEVLALRAGSFPEVEHQHALALDYLIAALPKLRTTDITHWLGNVEALQETVFGAKREKPRSERQYENEALLLIAMVAHLGAELDRRIPPRER